MSFEDVLIVAGLIIAALVALAVAMCGVLAAVVRTIIGDLHRVRPDRDRDNGDDDATP